MSICDKKKKRKKVWRVNILLTKGKILNVNM